MPRWSRIARWPTSNSIRTPGKLGRLTVWSSTQVPYYLQHKLSLVLEMPMSQIRVIKPLVGGGFGGKSEIIPLRSSRR